MSTTKYESTDHKITSSKSIANIDDIMEAIKPLGRYQLFMAFIYLYATFPLSCNNGFMAFDSAPKFICNDYPTNGSSADCQVYYNCTPGNLTLDVQFFSVAHEWKLICDRSYFVSLITSVQMVGDFVGAMIIGYFSDTYGRKPTFIIVIAAQLLLGSLSSLCTSWPLFAAFRFFIGFCAGAEMVAAWVLVAECTTNRYRYLFRAFGASTLNQFDQTLIAYLTKEWRGYSLYANLQGIPLLILLIFFTFESPRWLAEKGKTDQFHSVIKKIARINGTSDRIPKLIDIQATQKVLHQKANPLDLFKTRRLAKSLLASVLTWFIIATIYYGMYFNISYLPANIYLSMTILGFVIMLEMPVAIFDACNPKLNRKWTLLAALGTATTGSTVMAMMLGCMSHEALSRYDILISVVSVITQLASSITFSQAYLFAIELFPTLLRSTAGSMCSAGGRIGAILAPQLLFIRKYWPAAPYVCFAILGFIGLVVDWIFLPNSNDVRLPEDHTDANDRCKDEKTKM